MRSGKRFFICLFFIIVGVKVAFAMDVGEQAPDFRLESVAGGELSLSEFKGQTVLLKLGTTWCPTCKHMTDEILSLADVLEASKVVCVEVFIQDSRQMVEKYLDGIKTELPFHALLDDGQVFKDYNVYLIPRLLIVDTKGIIRFDNAGRNVSKEELVGLVRKVSVNSQ